MGCQLFKSLLDLSCVRVIVYINICEVDEFPYLVYDEEDFIKDRLINGRLTLVLPRFLDVCR